MSWWYHGKENKNKSNNKNKDKKLFADNKIPVIGIAIILVPHLKILWERKDQSLYN